MSPTECEVGAVRAPMFGFDRGGDRWHGADPDTAAVGFQHAQELAANAIDTSFARWERSHLHQFVLADGRRIGMAEYDEDDELGLIDGAATTLAKLQLGEQFYYEFDFGDGWTDLCTVGTELIDPLDTLGIKPREPLPDFGWGVIPDQHGRRWADDDGAEGLPPPDSELPEGFPW